MKKVIDWLDKAYEMADGFIWADNADDFKKRIELRSLFDSIKAELRKGVLADASGEYYNVKCEKCGWYGSTEFVDGGGQIADTGDYNDIFCPACGSSDLEDLEELKTLTNRETPGSVQVINHVIYEITEALKFLDIKPCPDRDVGNVIEYNLEDGINRLRNLICTINKPRRYTPKQWEQRTGKPWPDSWPVFFEYGENTNDYHVDIFRKVKSERVLKIGRICCFTEAGPPPNNWSPEAKE